MEGLDGPPFSNIPAGYKKTDRRREAALWNHFNSSKFDWYPIREWPKYIQEMALKEHKNNRERYKLFLFFVGNGMNPYTATINCMLRDVRPSEYDRGRKYDVYPYDHKAMEHFAQLQREAETGRLQREGKYYDLNLKMVMTPEMNEMSEPTLKKHRK